MLAVNDRMIEVGTSVSTQTGIGSAIGWISVLQEEDPMLRHAALVQLLAVVDIQWHEIAQVLPELEAMAEEGVPTTIATTTSALQTSTKVLAASVASHVLFHLQEQEQALKWALLTVNHPEYDCFARTETDSPYATTLIAAALNAYIALQQHQWYQQENAGSTTTTSTTEWTVEQLRPMVYRLLDESCNAGQMEYAISIALEACELEILQHILQKRTLHNGIDLLRYTIRSIQYSDTHPHPFRISTLQFIAQQLQQIFVQGINDKSTTINTTTTVVCYDLVYVLHTLQSSEGVAQVLAQLLQSNSELDQLIALQIAFDLHDTGHHAFVKAVADQLIVQCNTEPSQNIKSESVLKILVGGFASELNLSFLHKQSKADRLLMENLKKGVEMGSRSNSMLHNAAVVTHSYLYAGTTNDSFLRDYLDWMKKASIWAKFSATASLGVVHASHVTEAYQLLEPYLPPTPDENTVVSPDGGYAEGGSLYALGLIHGTGCASTQREETITYLRKQLRASHENEVISHGACLGVGLTAMGSADIAIVQELKDILDTDSAVAGEAAGLAIGMVLAGTGAGNTNHRLTKDADEIHEIVTELKNYARETLHEKIIRGISMGLALMNFGQEENADATIEEMRSDRDPVLRYGAQYAIALAYCGTGSNKAIRILLHTAVSDVSDDVRMAAVIGLAFVLYKTPEKVPGLVKLLLESFNPHVRYASCMAVGMAMAGTGDLEGIALLEPMLDDMTDYVRQGALMGTAMIYMQQSDTCNNRKIRGFREKLSSIISEKHQSTLTKMGAILSTGILDAGGRNCSLQLGSRSGFTKVTSAVGLALWLQHWHWYPLMHMFSLALTPTLTIGLNKNFKYPKGFEIVCNCKPSQFAYPKKLEEKKEKEKKRVETVTLSITAKEKARLARKKAKEGGADAMEVDGETDTKKQAAEEVDENKEDEAMDVDDEDKPKKKREPEPNSFKIGNPARITKAQSVYCEFDLTQRYRPLRATEKPFGVIILTDSTPEEEEDVVAVKPPSLEPEGELPPPEPFEWTPPPVLEQADETSESKNEEKPSESEASSNE